MRIARVGQYAQRVLTGQPFVAETKMPGDGLQMRLPQFRQFFVAFRRGGRAGRRLSLRVAALE
jgi:hypothetical protein